MLFVHLACALNDKPHSPQPSIPFCRVQPLAMLVQNPYQVLFVHSSAMSLLVFLWFLVIFAFDFLKAFCRGLWMESKKMSDDLHSLLMT